MVDIGVKLLEAKGKGRPSEIKETSRLITKQIQIGANFDITTIQYLDANTYKYTTIYDDSEANLNIV